MILVLDFGSQTAHLIARRIKDFGVPVRLIHPEDALSEIKKGRTSGIILSGGPASVYEKGAPTVDKKIFSLGIPILGICYGLQVTAKLLQGKVIAGRREYGPVLLQIPNSKFQITNKLKKTLTVWMSHGDEIVKLPDGFTILGTTDHMPFALVENSQKKIYGLQFHPEVEHTQQGLQILENFLDICNLRITTHAIDPVGIEDKIRSIVKRDEYVIGAVSGGVDSTVAAVLTAKAIGKRFIPMYVDNGLMRAGTREHVKKIFAHIGITPDIVFVENEMLRRLKGIDDPEEKRKIIGSFYIEVFEKEMKRLVKTGKNVAYLMQGTIFSDVIESKGSKHAAKIKSHHNVGGLPKELPLKLLEPLREFYKDEVRSIGRKLGLAEEFVNKQVFPGPGYAIRIRGEVTKERLEKEKQADAIVLEELEKAGILPKIYMSFPIMTGASSTAVKGDGRFFGEVIALRIIESTDVMTTTWAKVPYALLQRISSRIVNEVPHISRVVFDITTKPPATMEWE